MVGQLSVPTREATVKSSPYLLQPEKARVWNKDPVQPKINIYTLFCKI